MWPEEVLKLGFSWPFQRPRDLHSDVPCWGRCAGQALCPAPGLTAGFLQVTNKRNEPVWMPLSFSHECLGNSLAAKASGTEMAPHSLHFYIS